MSDLRRDINNMLFRINKNRNAFENLDRKFDDLDIALFAKEVRTLLERCELAMINYDSIIEDMNMLKHEFLPAHYYTSVQDVRGSYLEMTTDIVASANRGISGKLARHFRRKRNKKG